MVLYTGIASPFNSVADGTKIAGLVVSSATPPSSTAPVVADLQSDDTCGALGTRVKSQSPVLALCRKLIKAGQHAATPLDVYRCNTLALRVKSIGEAAGLEVNGDGTGFRPATKPGRASPLRQNLEAASEPLVTRLGCGTLSPAEPQS